MRVFSSNFIRSNTLFSLMHKSSAVSLFALLLVCTIAITSCRDQEEHGPVLHLTPASLVMTRNAGDLLEFSIQATAGDNALRNLRITQKPENSITTVIKDTALYGKAADFFFVYTVPSGTERVLLTFTLYDTEGKSYATLRDVYIQNGTPLQETTGIELDAFYTPNGVNAFRIQNLELYQLATNPDSTLIDLVEKDLTDDGVMSRTLTSYSGIRFVRNNSFNYAEASNTSAANSYNSSNAQQLISNVAVNDLLIAKYDTINNKYAIIKIMAIYDEEGSVNDRYIFNIKK